LDKDANGSVSKEEFLASPGAKKDAAKAETAFGKKDKDANGSLSMEEFAAAPKKKKAA
jgi:Ca2+-binding EF-hand superfamily protein